MLFLILAWLFIFVISTGYGLVALKLLQKFRAFRAVPAAVSLELVSVAGLCFLAWVLGVVSFVSGINITVQVVLAAGGVLSLVLNSGSLKRILRSFRETNPFPFIFWPLFLLFGLLTLLHASDYHTFSDTGLYHAQFIQWVQEFRVVPGLGNLHGRLAFNSHAHVLAAFFSLPNAFSSPLHQAFGSYLFVLAGCFGSRQLLSHFKKQNRSLLFYGGFLLLLFICYRPWISSPMPDSTVAIFIFFAAALLLEKINTNALQQTDIGSGLLLILLATLVTFKLSAVFLAILVLYQFFFLPNSERKSWLMSSVSVFVFILLPWLGRNVLLSGHLVYPLPMLDLFHFGWEIPAAQVQREQLEILHFARIPNMAWQENIGVPLSAWFGPWFRIQEHVSKVLFIAVLALLAIQGILFGRRNFKKDAPLFGLFLLFCACCVVWFFTAPAFRFGYGYLISAVLLGGLSFFREKLPKFLPYLVIITCFAYVLNGIKNEVKTRPKYTLIWPAPYHQTKTVVQYLNGMPVRIKTVDGRCGNVPLPCTWQLAPGLELRGSSLQDGFRIQEKTKAK